MSGAADLTAFAELLGLDHGLCVLATTRADGSVQASLVNAGVMRHPFGDGEVVALVAGGGARKLAHLRARPRTTLVARAGWDWVTVEGDAVLVGPDDPVAGVDDERLRVLRREVFAAAGGRHDDLDEYDRVMVAERRVVVLVRPVRIYTNG